MAERGAFEKARRLLGQDVTDETVEAATGLSLAEIIGLRAERAATPVASRKRPRPRPL